MFVCLYEAWEQYPPFFNIFIILLAFLQAPPAFVVTSYSFLITFLSINLLSIIIIYKLQPFIFHYFLTNPLHLHNYFL